MKKIALLSVNIFACAFWLMLSAQQDTIMIDNQHEQISMLPDTLTRKVETKKPDSNIDLKLTEVFQPNPTRAVLYSVIFPGLGQIYNRKYWKLPLVYGGFLGVLYAVTWNGNTYSDYQTAYKDIILNPRGTTSWHDFVLNPQETLDNPASLSRTTDFLKRRRDYFRRNRDLAIIIGVGLYALCMIDAYVDAQLYNFTVTPDLSMTVSPVVWGPSNLSSSIAVGFQCNIVF